MDALDVRVPPAGVLDQEALAVPIREVGNPVARDARVVFHHGLAAAEEAVDQRRLAHVRAADDRDRAQRLLGRLRAEAVGLGELLPRGLVVLACLRARTRVGSGIVGSGIGGSGGAVGDAVGIVFHLRELEIELRLVEVARGPAAELVRHQIEVVGAALRPHDLRLLVVVVVLISHERTPLLR